MIKKIVYAVVLYFVFFGTPQVVQASGFIPTHVIVKYKIGQSPTELQNTVSQRRESGGTIIGNVQRIFERVQLGLRGEKPPEDKLQELQITSKEIGVVETKSIFNASGDRANQIGLQNVELIKTTGKISTDKLLKKYQALPEVLYAEKDTGVHIFTTPNDPSYAQQWGLPITQVDSAWNIATGSSSVKVAILDTGIDYTHPDLPTDIVKGKNYITGTNDPMDDNGHGTHVAGIIGALNNNGIGISGIDQKVTLIAVKVLDVNGQGLLSNAASGIVYATDNGAKVINLSFGGDTSPCPSYLQDAITYASGKGVLVVAAAGNGNDTTGIAEDVYNVSPASCNGVVAVAATNQTDQRASFSNFGTGISISAPGAGIISTWPGNTYKTVSGTSTATPFVSAIAALLISRNPILTPYSLTALLQDNGDVITTDQPIGKRINAYKALQHTPLGMTNFTVSIATNSATFAWNTPATSSAQVQYGWKAGQFIATPLTDTSPMKTSHSVTISSLAPCESFHYQAFSVDALAITGSTIDNTFTTLGCSTTAPVVGLASYTIATASGAVLGLTTNSNIGLLLTVPPAFATSDATFQIDQLSTTEALATTSTVSQNSLIGNFIYELKAFRDTTTSASSFATPLTVTINYNLADVATIKETSIAIYQWDGNGWNILSGCSVNTKLHSVSCTTTHFSVFGVFGPTQVVSSTSNTSSSSSTGSQASNTATSCQNLSTSNAPNLFQVTTTSTSAQLYFTPLSSGITYYNISYGLTQSASQFGAIYSTGPSTGVTTFTVNSLTPNTTYYFKVAPGNSCMLGNYSNSFQATTGNLSSNGATIFYKNGISQLGNASIGSVSTASGSINQTVHAYASGQTNTATLPASLPAAGSTDIVKVGTIGIGLSLLGIVIFFLAV